MLRDRLACSTRHNCIQQKLLSEGEGLTFEKAIQIALSMESAIEQANEIHSYQYSNIESVNKLFKGESSCCFHCGVNTHTE